MATLTTPFFVVVSIISENDCGNYFVTALQEEEPTQKIIEFNRNYIAVVNPFCIDYTETVRSKNIFKVQESE